MLLRAPTRSVRRSVSAGGPTKWSCQRSGSSDVLGTRPLHTATYREVELSTKEEIRPYHLDYILPIFFLGIQWALLVMVFPRSTKQAFIEKPSFARPRPNSMPDFISTW